jgi:hypothetical protein
MIVRVTMHIAFMYGGPTRPPDKLSEKRNTENGGVVSQRIEHGIPS